MATQSAPRLAGRCAGGHGLARARRSRWLPLELTDGGSVASALAVRPGRGGAPRRRRLEPRGAERSRSGLDGERRRHRAPGGGAGSAAATRGRGDALLLVVSSGEVYGRGRAGCRGCETDPVRAAVALRGQQGGRGVGGARGLAPRPGCRSIVARPFTHTGPGQDDAVRAARRSSSGCAGARAQGRTEVPTGNLEPVRDLLDVRDVVDAYLALLVKGRPGEVYNVSRGEGIRSARLFHRLARLVGCRGRAEARSRRWLAARRSPLPGGGFDASCVRATGWAPRDLTGRDAAGTAGCPSGLTSRPFSSSAPARSSSGRGRSSTTRAPRRCGRSRRRATGSSW